jgi:hypothetical protein
MKLSIYPKVNSLPKNKDDKILQSKLASNPNLPQVLEIATDEDLIQAVTSYGWSPSLFSGFRHNDNFISADFMSLDIDSGLTIEEAERRIQRLELACLCLPSPSHTEQAHKFRLIFPMVKTILNKDDFDATWDWLLTQFPELDKQCSDYARWYAPSKMEAGFWQDGEFLVPKKGKKEEELSYNSHETQVLVPEELGEIVKLLYGKNRDTIPEAVEFFLTNAASGLPGLWINSLNACVFSLALSGVDATIIEEVMSKISPNELDKKDLYQIKRSVKDGTKARENLQDK